MRAEIPPLLDTADVSRIFQVTKATVRRWYADGLVPGLRIGRALRFRRRDVERAIEHLRNREDVARG